MSVFALLLIGSCFAQADKVVNGHLYGGPIYQVEDRDSLRLVARNIQSKALVIATEQEINWNYTKIECPKEVKRN